MLSSRQKLILKAIIDLYIEDASPVGSKLLTQLPYLDFSSATIRYDMAQLEELGYLEKTHTSSGRIPSIKGYRYYVEHLVTRDQEVSNVFPLIDEIFIKNTYAKENAIKEALHLLTELTNYTAIAVGRDVERLKIAKLDFIPLSENEAVILIVTDQGHVSHQQISIPDHLSIQDVKEVVSTLDDLLKNRYLHEASEILQNKLAKEEINRFMEYQDRLIDSFIQAFSKFANDNFYLSGMTNVFEQPEFSNISHIKKFMEMINRRQLLELVSSNNGLSIKFSNDTQIMPIDNMTVISIPYRISEDEIGTLAIIGPARMSYKRVIPLLEYIAANLAKLYKNKKE